MSFFYANAKNRRKTPKNKRIPTDTLRERECKACPLDKASLVTPKMEATGPDSPSLYFLGEAPGENEDKRGKQFVGSSGKYLRPRIPRQWEGKIRWNNVIRCHPAGNRNPTDVEINCCYKSLEQDIEDSKPWGVVGFGNIPLKRMIGRSSGISLWRGRRVPVKVGEHVCWFFPMEHPSYLLRKRKKNKRTGEYFESEHDSQFSFDLKAIEKFRRKYGDELLPFYEEEENYNKNIEYVLGKDKSELNTVMDWLDELEELDAFGIDYETTHLRPYEKDSRILTVAVGIYDKTYAFPLDHPKAWDRFTTKRLHKRFKQFILNSGIKIAHNLSMEQEWSSYFYGEEVLTETEWEDTMAQAYVMDSRKGMLSLDDLVLLHCGFDLKRLANLNKANMISEPLNKVVPYNGRDTKYTHKVWEIQKRILELEEMESLEDTYDHHIRTSITVVKMQRKGVQPDLDEIEKIHNKIQGKVGTVIGKIKNLKEVKRYEKLVGHRLNPRSDDQLIELFRRVLKRKEIISDKNKSGYSIDEEALKSIPRSASKLPALILEMRNLNKIDSTYVYKLLDHISPDGLIHANINDKKLDTGRFSIDNPSLQNFPNRKDKWVRRVIRAYMDNYLGIKEWTFVAADYGQIEARVIAMFTQDPVFVKALWDKYDIHQFWAERFIELVGRKLLDQVARQYELPRDNEKKIIDKIRFNAKNGWVFPQFFGASYYSCAGYMNINESICKKVDAEFWDMFRGVKKWHKDVVKFYERYGYVEMLTGRRRYGPINYNMIINTPVQGTASDIVVDASNRCEENDYVPNINIHDDLSFYLPTNTVDKDIDNISRIMCFPEYDFINVPISIEVTEGPNWYDQDEYGIYESNDGKTKPLEDY